MIILMRTVGRMICALKGHLRGKQTGIDILCPDGSRKRSYICPRCGSGWTRKLPKTKEAA